LSDPVFVSLISGLDALLRLLHPDPAVAGLVFEIPLIILGMAAFVRGIRALRGGRRNA
jgi:hypothetical protein